MRVLNPRDFSLRLKMRTISGQQKNPEYIITDMVKDIIKDCFQV